MSVNLSPLTSTRAGVAWWIFGTVAAVAAAWWMS